MYGILTYLTSRSLPIVLILGSLVAVLYVYHRRRMLLQLKFLKRRSKP